MTPMSIVGRYVPRGQKHDIPHLRMLAQSCFDGDRNRTEPSKLCLVVVRGSTNAVRLCERILGMGLSSSWGTKDATSMWDDSDPDVAIARFKMLKKMRNLRVYLIIKGAENLKPLSMAA